MDQETNQDHEGDERADTGAEDTAPIATAPSRPDDPRVLAAAAGRTTTPERSTESPRQHRPSQRHNRGPPLDDEPIEAAKQADRLADDLLSGGPEIANFLGCPLREVYHLAKTKRLPIGRLGRKLIASRNQLRRAAKALTAT